MSGFVSERALIERINRKLARDGQKLKTSRSARAECDLGRHFVIDTSRNCVVERDVRLRELGGELGVLRHDGVVVSDYDAAHLLHIEEPGKTVSD
jgi:hypothetical protein